MKFKKKLVSKIKELREAQNILQQELADLAGVSRQTIYYLEKGVYNPKLTLSFKISEILKSPIEEIFYFEPVIKDLIGEKTLNELEDISEDVGISLEDLQKLRYLDENKLSTTFKEDQMIKIAKSLKVKFEDLFIK